MPRIYTDLQFRNQSSYTTSTSSSEFDSFGDRLVSSINMEEIEEYAKYLGMDMKEDRDLFYIAKEGLKAPLPD